MLDAGTNAIVRMQKLNYVHTQCLVQCMGSVYAIQ